MGLLGSDDDDGDKGNWENAGFEPTERIDAEGKPVRERMIDEEAGVVLYFVNTMNNLALTAVPLEDTELETGQE